MWGDAELAQIRVESNRRIFDVGNLTRPFPKATDCNCWSGAKLEKLLSTIQRE